MHQTPTLLLEPAESGVQPFNQHPLILGPQLDIDTPYDQTPEQLLNNTISNTSTAITSGNAGEDAGGSCWMTLATRPSYLPGVITHTLDKQNSAFPLLVQYTSSLGEEAIKTLQVGSKRTGRKLTQEVRLLHTRAGQENQGSVADRFNHTFAKLRAFEIYKLGYTKCCFLDADMAVFQNPDSIFDTSLPGNDLPGATHDCICNLSRAPKANPGWNRGNSAYTSMTGPYGIAPENTSKCRPTYHLLNSGMFLYYPSEVLWTKVLDFFNTTDKL
jgi:inositol 3-alpha-galactosyltransferase